METPLDLGPGYKLTTPGKCAPEMAFDMGGQSFVTAREMVGLSQGRLEPWKLLEHLESARKRNWPFPKVNEFPDGEVAICGSGPSIGKFEQLKELRRLQKRGVKVHGINRCPDFLATKGIFCDSASLLDPIPNVANYITPRRKTEYFIGFQCHPDTFDAFDKPDIRKHIWYCRTTNEIDRLLTPRELAYAVPSRTSTNGLRSIMLNYMRGFRRFHFFGFDSSYETELDANGVEQIKLSDDGKGRLHAHAKPETIHDVRTTRVCEMDPAGDNVVYEKEYFTNSAMLAQADEFISLISDIAQGFKQGLMDQVYFHVHGDGLIPDIACSVKYPFHADRSRIRTNDMKAIRPAPRVPKRKQMPEFYTVSGPITLSFDQATLPPVDLETITVESFA